MDSVHKSDIAFVNRPSQDLASVIGTHRFSAVVLLGFAGTE